MDQTSIDHVKGVIETLLFVSEKPVTLQQIKEVTTGVSASDIRKLIDCLKDEYDNRNSGMTIAEMAGGYRMLSSSNYASYIRAFYKTKHKEKLSKPALETLAIVAYKQPVTRADVEIIRGVNSDGVVSHLLNKELIKIVGRKDVPGRPYLYGTTKLFLDYFGLRGLESLPKLQDFPNAAEKMEELAQEADQRDEKAAQEAAKNEPNLEQAIAEVEEEMRDETAGEEIVEEIEQKLNENEEVLNAEGSENEPK